MENRKIVYMRPSLIEVFLHWNSQIQIWNLDPFFMSVFWKRKLTGLLPSYIFILYIKIKISLHRSVNNILKKDCDTKFKYHFCLFLHHFEVCPPSSSSVCHETAFLSLDQHYFHELVVCGHFATFFSTSSALWGTKK